MVGSIRSEQKLSHYHNPRSPKTKETNHMIIHTTSLTINALSEITKLDRTLVSTPDYMGLAYFWGHDYKHSLRDATATQRRKIHNTWLERGIDFINQSEEGWNVIEKIIPNIKHR